MQTSDGRMNKQDPILFLELCHRIAQRQRGFKAPYCVVLEKCAS